MRRSLLFLFACAAPLSAAEPQRFEKVAVIHLREESGEAIDDSLKASVVRRMEEAQKWGAECIVFEIESYGGLVTASIETGDKILGLPEAIHTIAYIRERAISGAAMISFACREIVMSEVGSIGASQAILIGPTGIEEGPEKIQSPVRATFRKYAQKNGYPEALAEAMVSPDIEVVRFRRGSAGAPSQGSEWVYYRGDRAPDEAAQQRLGLTDREVVVPEGELLTLTAQEALEYGIASRLLPDLDALLSAVQAPGARLRELEWSGAERLSRWLLGIRSLLFFLGIGALYFALKTPGTGVPEVLALAAFGLYFGAAYVADFAGTIEIVLFFAGVALIVVEIFVLPGFGVPGILGFAAVLTSLALAAVPEGGTGTLDTTDVLVPVARDFILGAIGAGVAVFFLARHLPTLPLFRKLALEPGPAAGELQGSAVGRPVEGAGGGLVGRRGVAETPLRPAGRVRVDGRRWDVVTEGTFVEAGRPVKVISVRGNTVVVRRIDETA